MAKAAKSKKRGTQSKAGAAKKTPRKASQSSTAGAKPKTAKKTAKKAVKKTAKKAAKKAPKKAAPKKTAAKKTAKKTAKKAAPKKTAAKKAAPKKAAPKKVAAKKSSKAAPKKAAKKTGKKPSKKAMKKSTSAKSASKPKGASGKRGRLDRTRMRKPVAPIDTIRTPERADDIKARLGRLSGLVSKLRDLKRHFESNFYAAGEILREIEDERLFEVKGYGSIDAFVDRETDLGASAGANALRATKVFQRDAAETAGFARVVAALHALDDEPKKDDSSLSRRFASHRF